jgi:hypothetical protein
VGVPTLLLLLAGSVPRALAQQCLGRPVEAGEQAIAARLDLDELSIVSAEYSGAAEAVAWSAIAGAAADELIPPGDFALALGGGSAWTSLHRAICCGEWPFSGSRSAITPPARTSSTVRCGSRPASPSEVRGGTRTTGEFFSLDERLKEAARWEGLTPAPDHGGEVSPVNHLPQRVY